MSVVVGYTHRDEGEYIPFRPGGGDRHSLTLGPQNEALIASVAAANLRTVVVMIAGYSYFHGQRLLDKNGEEPALASPCSARAPAISLWPPRTDIPSRCG